VYNTTVEHTKTNAAGFRDALIYADVFLNNSRIKGEARFSNRTIFKKQ